MKTFFKIIRPVTLFWLAGFIAFVACEKEIDPDENDSSNNNSNNNGEITLEADEAAELLSLENATRLSGSLPEAPDKQLKINVEDTIYLMEGTFRGAKILVKHDGLYDITGFYIGVENSSFYFDVPVVIEEAQDSTDVVFINLGATDGLDWDFSFPIAIIPHADGIPWDKFIKVVKAEKPVDPEKDQGCSFAVPASVATDSIRTQRAWIWDYTVLLNYNDEFVHYEAPGLKKVSTYTTGGCCNEDGTSTTVANDPYCYEKHNTGEQNKRWRSLDVSHFYVLIFDEVTFFDNGRFENFNFSMQTNYRPSLSDFCEGEAGYDFDRNSYFKEGSWELTPETNFLKITYDVNNPPVGGKIIPSAEIEYNCHILVLKREVEGQTLEIVFRKHDWDRDFDYDEFDALTAIYD